jgi:hypothetical protein
MALDQILSDLKVQRTRLDEAIAALDGSRSRRGRRPMVQSGRTATHKRTVSPAVRKRIGLAIKLAWARRKGKATPKRAAAPAKKATVRRPMSPAARRKLSRLTKARWVARKRAGATTL